MQSISWPRKEVFDYSLCNMFFHSLDFTCFMHVAHISILGRSAFHKTL